MPSSTGVRLLLKFNFGQKIRAAGWSEAYDLGYADLPTAVAQVNAIQAFILDRVYCLGFGPVLMAATVIAYTQPPIPGAPPARRNTLSLPVPPFPKSGQAYNKAFNPATPFPADFAPTVYYIRLQTALSGSPVYSRNVWMAGLPDLADESDNNQVVDPATLTAVNKFMGDLNNTNPTLGGRNSVSIRSVDRSGANPIKACTAWNLLANTYTVPAHGFAANQPIIAEGMKTAPGGSAPRGRYLVGTVVDVNTITLAGAKTPTAPLKTGGFRAAVFTFNTVAVATGQGFTKRNKGKPFFPSVGRRRTPQIARS